MDMFISDSDWESCSDSDSSEDQEGIYSLYDGQAQSILSSLEESIGKIDEFLSFERGFLHGDMVCSVTDPSGQMGRVVSVDMVVDLENVHGKITKNVNSKMLLRIRSITVGDYVAHGPWLGRVAKVVDTITIMFDDGSKCEVTAVDPEKVLPISPNLLEDPQYPFYPGLRVQVRHSTASNSARWFCGAWKANNVEGTVCSVKASLVYVDWLASVLVGCNKSLPPLPTPPCLQESKNLTLLSCFPHANWQLGDWCILPISSCKGVMEKMLGNSSTCEIIEEYMKIEKGFKGGHNSNFEEIFVIAKTKTKVDVVWQDGSQSFGLDSQSLNPANVVNAHEFWPQQFVLEKGTCDDPRVSSSQKWGVVMGVDAKERTVKVKWKTSSPKQRNDLGRDWMEETVSAYELVEHPDYSYCYSDVVFRMVQDQNADQADKDHVNSEIGLCVEAAAVDKNCVRDKNECPDKYYLSYIGNVTGFEVGAVEVRWADGLITKVAPHEIFRIDKYDVLAPTPVLSDENVEELNQEIIEHGKQSSRLKEKDLLNAIGVDEDCKKHQWESTSSFLPRSAIGYFRSIAASLFGYFGSTSLSGSMLSGHNYEDGNKSKTAQENELEYCNLLKEEEPPMAEGECQICETTSLKQPIKGIQENIDFPFSSDSNSSKQFKRFDMVGDCSDHHFLDGAGKGSALSQVKQNWLKKVQQEWNILENNLPETIYVRVYEERMDLMRAAIIGAPGTPYHDGLFFFDIFLPPEYPHEPPLLHYHSGGLRVNPNLYESGKVCLSLLNTWAGTGTEVWNHGSSTILQVLLSLQALVLNDKPYFNEAGYDKQIGRAEGEKNSVSYNENAFIVTCKSMLYTLRRPPKHFEAFVEEHFSRRSQYILSACKAYMEGTPIGCDFGKEQTEHENQKESSKGFKIMLDKLFPKFLEAFSDKGFDCSQFVATKK